MKSTYRLRSRRGSSEFPVINYGVDDRVPSLFLLLLLLLPACTLPFFFYLFLFFFFFFFPPSSFPSLSSRPRSYRSAHPFLSSSTTSTSLSLSFLSCSVTLCLSSSLLFFSLRSLGPSFFFIHLTASRGSGILRIGAAFEPRVVPIHKTVDRPTRAPRASGGARETLSWKSSARAGGHGGYFAPADFQLRP